MTKSAVVAVVDVMIDAVTMTEVVHFCSQPIFVAAEYLHDMCDTATQQQKYS